MMPPAGLRGRSGVLVAVVATVAVAVVVGCSGDSTPNAQSTSPTISSPTVTTTPPAPPTTTPTPKDPYPALCRLIDITHVQTLFKSTLGPMTTGGSSDCQFTPKGAASDVAALKVYLRLDDADKTLYDHIGDISYGRFAPLTGLGYQAKWGSDPFTGLTVVDVRQGDFTCTVIPPVTPTVLTLQHPGEATDAPYNRSVLAAFAGDVGQLCRDIFSQR